MYVTRVTLAHDPLLPAFFACEAGGIVVKFLSTPEIKGIFCF
jgi:hypothetical protein